MRIVFGAGFWGRRAVIHEHIHGRQVDAVAVTDVLNNPRELLGKAVLPITDFLGIKEKAEIIIAVSDQYKSEVLNKLLLCGFQNVHFSDVKSLEYKEYTGISYDRFLSGWFCDKMGWFIDFDNINCFTEKIQWLKLNDCSKVKRELTDKYRVRSFIESRIGKEYLIPLYGTWECFDDIEWKELPEQFVLKCNNGWGANIIVRDKKQIDLVNTKNMINAWLNMDYGYKYGLELQYKDINPVIIAEEYIEQIDGNLVDYKIHCFDGIPRFIQCIGDRNFSEHTAYQMNYSFDWNELDWIFEDYPKYNHSLEKPNKLMEMYSIAKSLAKGFKYVRVDLYEVNSHIYFGEMTFTPASGVYPYRGTWNNKRDLELGEWLDIH